MGYYELLPKREQFLRDLLSIGVTDDQEQELVVEAMADLLYVWSDYYDTELGLFGHEQDEGARDALRTLCKELLPPEAKGEDSTD